MPLFSPHRSYKWYIPQSPMVLMTFYYTLLIVSLITCWSGYHHGLYTQCCCLSPTIDIFIKTVTSDTFTFTYQVEQVILPCTAPPSSFVAHPTWCLPEGHPSRIHRRPLQLLQHTQACGVVSEPSLTENPLVSTRFSSMHGAAASPSSTASVLRRRHC